MPTPEELDDTFAPSEDLEETQEGLLRRSGYRKRYAKEFYDLCCQGLFLTQIAHKLNVSKKSLKDWSKSKKYPDFVLAYERGMEACQSFHEGLLADMIEGRLSVSAAAIQQQRDRLRVQFKDDWSDNKQEIKIESSYERMSDDELQNQLLKITAKPNSRRLLEEMLKDTKQEFKVIDGGKEKNG